MLQSLRHLILHSLLCISRALDNFSLRAYENSSQSISFESDWLKGWRKFSQPIREWEEVKLPDAREKRG